MDWRQVFWLIHIMIMSDSFCLGVESNDSSSHESRGDLMVTVMIGGNLREDNLDIWETMVHLAGGVEVEFIFFNKHLKYEFFS